jgi:Cu(I)/Ag(I) efflux system membrane fusion protein
MIKDIRIKSFASLIPMFCFLMFSCQQKHKQSVMEDLTPVNSIMLSEAQIQLANIKVAEIDEGVIGDRLLITGVLKVNEQSAVNISSRSKGRIQKLFLKNTGETVRKGDPLYQFYGDELVAAEREYFNLESSNWNYNGRYEPSLALENKLLLLGMLPSQIAQLKKDGKILFSVTICSPVQGTIRSISITEGQYINEGQTLFSLADDSKLWVEAPVYPDELQYLKVGMPATVIVPNEGNIPVTGTICFINPSHEQGKNVTLIRMQIDNSDRKLYPGMLAYVGIQTQQTRGIVLPASAVITDKTGCRVWIRNEDGSFSGRTVTTGIQSNDSILILSGLDNSERIVTSGAYLLNSELILKKGILTEMKM